MRTKSKTHAQLFIYEDDFDNEDEIKYSAPENYTLADPDWNGKRNGFGEAQSKDNSLNQGDMLDAGVTWRQPL